MITPNQILRSPCGKIQRVRLTLISMIVTLTAIVTLFSSEPATAVTVTAITAGVEHNCALLDDGTVQCWGSNVVGQLGIGTNMGPESCGSNVVLPCSRIPVTVSGLNTATAVAAGGTSGVSVQHSCAVRADGTVQCWGDNVVGQLGIGTDVGPESCVVGSQITPPQSCSTVPVTVAGITTASPVVTGGISHTCVLLEDGSVQCWGSNSSGQLGDGNGGTGQLSPFPVPVSGITTATAVAAGQSYTCALLADGTVQCWGRNFFGQLGNGTTTGSSSPVSVSGITTATAIDAGDFHACAVLVDGTVRCWGWNPNGQLGNRTTSDSATPVEVSGITTATGIGGARRHSCAVLADGTVQCWGSNRGGQLGDGTRNGSSTPVLVQGLTTATGIATGGDGHSCALLAEGTVQCWGSNFVGGLGHGATSGSLTPVNVVGLGPASSTIVNNLVTTLGLGSSFDPAPAPNAPAGTFTIHVTFQNISAASISKPVFEVVELSGGNLLLNADGSPGGVGARLTPDVDSDDVLSPGEQVIVEFAIGLQERKRFTVFVNLLGVPGQ